MKSFKLVLTNEALEAEAPPCGIAWPVCLAAGLEELLQHGSSPQKQQERWTVAGLVKAAQQLFS